MNKELCNLNFLSIMETFLEYCDINTICNLRKTNNKIKSKTDMYIYNLFNKHIPPTFYFKQTKFSDRLEYLWLKMNDKFKGCPECFCDNQYIDCDNRLYKCNVCTSRIETCNTCDLNHICEYCSFKVCKKCNEKNKILETCYSCDISYCKDSFFCKKNNPDSPKMELKQCKTCSSIYCKILYLWRYM